MNQEYSLFKQYHDQSTLGARMSSETKPFLTYHSGSATSSTVMLSTPHSYKQRLLHDVRKNLISYLIVFALTTVVWMSVVFTFIPDISDGYRLRTLHPDARRHNITSGMKLLTCGESRTNAEARSKGCKYDVLLNGWVPEPCYDEEFVRPILLSLILLILML